MRFKISEFGILENVCKFREILGIFGNVNIFIAPRFIKKIQNISWPLGNMNLCSCVEKSSY